MQSKNPTETKDILEWIAFIGFCLFCIVGLFTVSLPTWGDIGYVYLAWMLVGSGVILGFMFIWYCVYFFVHKATGITTLGVAGIILGTAMIFHTIIVGGLLFIVDTLLLDPLTSGGSIINVFSCLLVYYDRKPYLKEEVVLG